MHTCIDHEIQLKQHYVISNTLFNTDHEIQSKQHYKFFQALRMQTYIDHEIQFKQHQQHKAHTFSS